jgi:hypothetical protein
VSEKGIVEEIVGVPVDGVDFGQPISLAIVLLIVCARAWVYFMEKRGNGELSRKLEQIHEDLQGRKKADKNVHPDIAWESIFAPAMKGAREKIINRIRVIQKNHVLVSSLPELRTQHHGAWKAAWNDLTDACKTAKVDGKAMSDFLGSVKGYWESKRDECYGELVKSMKGQPDGIGQLETWVSDMKDSFIHICEEWTKTGKDYHEQNREADESTEMPKSCP